MDKKTELLARVYFIVAVFLVLSLVIAYRVFKVAVLEGEKWTAQGSKNIAWKPLDADRGTIYADDGSVLATSIQFFEVRLDVDRVKQTVFKEGVDSLAFYLSTTIRSDKSKYEWKTDLQKARKAGNKYFFLAKGLNVEQYNLLKTFPIINQKRANCLITVKEGKRVKPYRDLAARTIGADRENAQKVGLEGSFDKFLTGPMDKVLQRRLSSGIWVPVYEPSEMGTKRGDDIITTINPKMQDVMHTELSAAMTKYNAPRAVGIMMEVATGQIKAISNLTNNEGIIQEVQNYAIGEKSEPGSTFKLATILALLESGKADINTLVNLNGGQRTKFADKYMADSDKHGRQVVTMKEAFAISSNIGIARLANDAFNTNQATRIEWYNYLQAFHLTAKTGIEIEGEPTPVIKHPQRDEKKWYGTTIPWMAHGYEVAVTPLQVLSLYNAVANNGKMMRPYLVTNIKGETEDVKEFAPRVVSERIASPSTIEQAQQMLKEVVLTGTATNIKNDFVPIAGKTGTTRVNYSNKEEYAKYNASFCGYFPADQPLYSMMVIVYEPQGVFYGSAVAAPVFKNIAEKVMAAKIDKVKPMNTNRDSLFALNHLPGNNAGYSFDFKGLYDFIGIPYKSKTENNWVYVDAYDSKMLIENKKIKKGVVPDVRGMGARDAVYVLENLGLGVAVQGSGKVARMSILPGTPIKGQRIEIYLN